MVGLGFGPISSFAARRSPFARSVVQSNLIHSGGQRKCVGDQFALMESVVTLSMLIRRFEFELTIKPEEVGFYTGATIHTRNGLPMRVKKRVLPGMGAAEGGDTAKSEPVSKGSAVAA